VGEASRVSRRVRRRSGRGGRGIGTTIITTTIIVTSIQVLRIEGRGMMETVLLLAVVELEGIRGMRLRNRIYVLSSRGLRTYIRLRSRCCSWRRR
jgi:hypothetical protein